MQVFLVGHEALLGHHTGRWHPERPERLNAVTRGVEDSGLEVRRVDAPAMSRDDIGVVHDPDYVDFIEALCREGGGSLDPDTVLSPGTWEAALRSAGGVWEAVRLLSDTNDSTAFVLCRPPGHHALPGRAMGFCVFNNVAVTAALLRKSGMSVAVVDWDVHHGNGTQTIVGDDPGVMYISLYQSPFYPLEGAVEDIHRDTAPGTIVNVPLPAGTAGDVYREAWERIVLGVLRGFEPEWVLVSAGYDAHAADPLAHLRLTHDDYGWLANRLASVHSPHRTVVALEGGYDLKALEESARATLQGLAGSAEWSAPLDSPPGSYAAVESAAVHVAKHWDI